MKLAITEDKRISDLQADFNHHFPYLKLEFFRNHTRTDQPVRLLDPASRIGDITYSMHEGSIQLSDGMTVSELEDIFRQRFGLEVQVYRKSGNIWLETTITDKWTLHSQNEHGGEIAASYAKPVPLSSIKQWAV